MAAGQGFIEFATGDVLTAASANGYLASQVVMVFADSAARTAAIASPQEGMFSYLKDTNSTEYYSGSAWVAVGGSASPGMTKIAASTFSAISSVNIDSLFSSTYKSYMMTLNCTSSASGTLNMQMRYGSTTVTSGDYYGGGWSIDRGGTTASYGQGGTTSRNIIPNLGGKSTITVFLSRVGNASEEASWEVTGTWGGQQESGHMSGLCNVAQTYTGIALSTSTGTVTGNYQIYGLAI